MISASPLSGGPAVKVLEFQRGYSTLPEAVQKRTSAVESLNAALRQRNGGMVPGRVCRYTALVATDLPASVAPNQTVWRQIRSLSSFYGYSQYTIGLLPFSLGYDWFQTYANAGFWYDESHGMEVNVIDGGTGGNQQATAF